MSKSVARLLKYGITSLVCLAAGVALCFSGGLFQATAWLDRFRILSDACFVPGALVFLFGVLVWLSNDGALLGISYALVTAFKALIPGGLKDRESYGQYAARKREGGKTHCGFLLIVGGIFLAISGVFLILFYTVK